MMQARGSSARRIFWSPVLFVGAVAAGVLLQAYVPVRFARGDAGEILKGAGVVLILVALGLAMLTLRELRRHEIGIGPAMGDHLVTSGPFAVSRNPVHLASLLVILGWGLLGVNAWMFALAVAYGYALQKLVIAPRESQLEHRYGKIWRDYRKRVRRWI